MEINHIKELEDSLIKYGLNKDDIILVGSAVLATNDIRKNNDIEIIIKPSIYKELIILHPELKLGYWGMKSIGKEVDLFHNIYSVAGFSDERIWKYKLYTVDYGYKIIDLEIEFLYKKIIRILKRREKDKEDYYVIKNTCRLKYIKKGNPFVSIYGIIYWIFTRIAFRFSK